MFKKLVAIGLAFSLSVAIAQANQFAIENFSGKVLVNKGKGYVRPKQGMTLRNGDRLFIGDRSAVSLNDIESGCMVDYSAPTVIKIGDDIPCAVQRPVQQQIVDVAPAPVVAAAPEAASVIGGEALPYILGGGALVGAGLLFIVLKPLSQ